MTVLTHITFLSYFYKSPASKAAQAPAKPRAQITPNPNGPHWVGLLWAGPSSHCPHGPHALPMSKLGLARVGATGVYAGLIAGSVLCER